MDVGTEVIPDSPMPYGGSRELWVITDGDACHWYLTAKYTPGSVVRVRKADVTEVNRGA